MALPDNENFTNQWSSTTTFAVVWAGLIAFALTAPSASAADDDHQTAAYAQDSGGLPVVLSAGGEISADALKASEIRARFAESLFVSASGEFNIPDTFRLPLFQGESVVVSRTAEHLSQDGKIIWSGRSELTVVDEGADYADVTLVADPATGRFGATLALPNKTVAIESVDGTALYRISELGDLNLDNDYVDRTVSGQNLTSTAQVPEVPGGETDANGVHIVDLFVGFSNAAAQGIDPDLVGNQMAAEVNNGLRNSEVTNVRVRFVGAGFTDDDRGVVTSWLNNAVIDEHFGDHVRNLKPDLIAVVQTYDSGNSTAAGWGQAPGTLSVNAIDGVIPISRHEIGHNAGAIHCPTGNGYNYGWKVTPNVGTHMCGNRLNFYSNPFVFDAAGNPMGDVDEANMAQVWRDRAGIMSGHRRHSVPFPGEGESTLSLTELTVNEGDGSADVVLKLSPVSTSPVAATVFTRANSARPGQDFYGATERIEFAAGEGEKTFSVTVIDDVQVENEEKFEVLLNDIDGAGVGVASAFVTITDNDRGRPVLSVDDLTVSESAATAQVQVRLDQAATVPVSVTVFSRATGSATPGTDFYGFTETLTFNPGERQKSVSLSIIDDNESEAAETLSVRLAQPSGAQIVDGVATVTISDNDQGGPVQLSIADVSVSESAGEARATVSLSGAATSPVEVVVFTRPGSARGGSDYYGFDRRLVFAPGEVEKIVAVTILNDTQVESAEAFTLNLVGAQNAEIADGSATVSIEDDD